MGGMGGMGVLTFARSVERAHVEDVYALHLAKNLQTLETGTLVEVGGHGTWRTSRRQEVMLAVNF